MIKRFTNQDSQLPSIEEMPQSPPTHAFSTTPIEQALMNVSTEQNQMLLDQFGPYDPLDIGSLEDMLDNPDILNWVCAQLFHVRQHANGFLE